MRSSVLLALLVTITLLNPGCRSLKDPEFRTIENLKLRKVGFSESGFTLDMVYFNPNRSRLQLKEAEGEAWIEGNYLGRFRIDTLVRIPAESDFRLPVRFQLDMRQLLKNSMISILARDVELKIEGKAKLGKAGLFIKYPIIYKGKHDIRDLFK